MVDRRPPPFSLRLTFEERAKIESDAAGMSTRLAISVHVCLILIGLLRVVGASFR